MVHGVRTSDNFSCIGVANQLDTLETVFEQQYIRMDARAMSRNFHKLSVLVVEDLTPMRRLIQEVLKSLEVGTIITAADGEEAFQKYLDMKPDVILTDWLMAPMDGISLIKRIRLSPQSPKRTIPIIMITGYTAPHRVAEARDIGVTEILVKPFTAGDLAKRLAYVINKPRDFVECASFFGPTRRRRVVPDYNGPVRRVADDPTADRDLWEIHV